MYLLPTMEEINKLRRAINPTAQIMDYLYSRPPAEGSMAEFFMESEDIELAMEDDCTEFDYIEDEILNMKRDINGFRIPRGQRRKAGIYDDYAGVDLGEKVSWDEI
jgi:hypothetical protein